jgi:hypothetical protein
LRLILGISLLLCAFALQPLLGALVELSLEIPLWFFSDLSGAAELAIEEKRIPGMLRRGQATETLDAGFDGERRVSHGVRVDSGNRINSDDCSQAVSLASTKLTWSRRA